MAATKCAFSCKNTDATLFFWMCIMTLCVLDMDQDMYSLKYHVNTMVYEMVIIRYHGIIQNRMFLWHDLIS